MLLAGLVLVYGCGSGAEADAEAVVREYAELLPSVYARSEPGLLAGAATEEEQNRVLMYMLYLKQKNESLETRLIDLEIAGSELLEGGTRATVETVEHWQYRSVNPETGEGLTGYTEAEYSSEYTLVLQDGKWLVSEVEVRETPAGSEQK